jgi:hypothetical protein
VRTKTLASVIEKKWYSGIFFLSNASGGFEKQLGKVIEKKNRLWHFF